MHTLPTIAAGLATSLLSLSAAAQIDCSALSAAVMPLPVQVSNMVIANSRVNPQINQRHIFCGEINAGGNAVGFHSQPLGHVPTQVNPPGAPAAPAASTIGAPVYIVPYGLNNPLPYRYMNSVVQIYNPATNAMVAKNGASTFFPDSCTQQAVVESIRYAYMHLSTMTNATLAFTGPSAPSINAAGYCVGENGNPFTISGYLFNDGANWWVNTAFPIASF